MNEQTKIGMKRLCESIIVEHNPEKFLQLVRKLNRLLQEHRQGLQNQSLSEDVAPRSGE